MLRVLFLTSYPSEAASTRFRVTQYFRFLEEHDVSCQLASMLSSRTFADFYVRKGRLQKAWQVMAGAAAQALRAFSVKNFDVVVVQRGALLFGPPVLEWLVAVGRQRPLVFDIDDAIWVHDPVSSWGALARLTKFPSKVSQITKMAKHVIVCNEYTRDYALRHRAASAITLIPTVVDAEVFRPVSRSTNAAPVVGWIGTHSTAEYLDDIIEPLREVGERNDFTLKIVGSSRQWHVPGVRVLAKPWSLAEEVADYQSLDIGLYPVRDGEWGGGKSGFKPVVYMSSGVACVASPVGGVTEFIQHQVNGLFASTNDEWCDSVRRLLEDGALRSRLAEAGRKTILDWYCLQIQAPRLLQVLQEAAA